MGTTMRSSHVLGVLPLAFSLVACNTNRAHDVHRAVGACENGLEIVCIIDRYRTINVSEEDRKRCSLTNAKNTLVYGEVAAYNATNNEMPFPSRGIRLACRGMESGPMYIDASITIGQLIIDTPVDFILVPLKPHDGFVKRVYWSFDGELGAGDVRECDLASDTSKTY
jgi:hypothetical protein